MNVAVSIIGIVTGIISVLLGGIAFWLSFYFYNQSKNSETNIKVTLAEIKSQTETLQKLSGRWMDRFTKFVTDSPPTEQVRTIIMALKEFQFPANMVTDLKSPEVSNTELITAYIVIYNYCGITNLLGQFSLPTKEKIDENPDLYENLKTIIDRSHRDFIYLNGLLQQVDPSLIQSCTNVHYLLQEADEIREMVMTTDEHYSKV